MSITHEDFIKSLSRLALEKHWGVQPIRVDEDIWKSSGTVAGEMRGDWGLDVNGLHTDESLTAIHRAWMLIAQALQAERDRDPWNYNMDEAPRDGSRILIALSDGTPRTAIWRDIAGAPGPQPTAFQLIKPTKGE